MLVFEERYYTILLGIFIPTNFKKYFEKARGGQMPQIVPPPGAYVYNSGKLLRLIFLLYDLYIIHIYVYLRNISTITVVKTL